MEKKISCGILICTEHGFLAVHPTGRKKEFGCYDIPKGCHEGNETYYQTAVRELKEETGLDLDFIEQFSNLNMYDFGVNKYLKDKDLVLYAVEIPDIDKYFSFKCTSFFENEHGMEIPEADWFMWVRDLNYYFKSLNKTFKELRENNYYFRHLIEKYENA